jgi:hypothetical protein
VPVDLRLDSHDHGLGAGPEAGRAPSLPPAADIAFAASPMGGTAGGATAGGTAGRAEGGGTAGRAEGGGTSGGAEGGGTTDGRSAAAAQGPPVLPHVHSRPRT